MMRRLLLFMCCAALLGAPAFAQQTGQINGIVTDNTGGVVPGATVKAVETNTGFSHDTVSGTDGRYSFSSLRPTQYDISAELSVNETLLERALAFVRGGFVEVAVS